jgi:MGT family glycosyltransferase
MWQNTSSADLDGAAMSKILVFNVPTQGHINPTLPVVAELVRRGTEVIYYLTESQRLRIEATSATFRAYDTIPDDYFDSRGLNGSNPPLAARTLIETTHAILPSLLNIVQREKPDVIVFDAMCPWGWYVAQIARIPSVSSMALLMLTPGMFLQSGQLLNLMMLALRNFSHIRTANSMAAGLGRTYSIKTLGFPNLLTSTGTITVSYTSAMFQPNGENFDKSIKFVGPAIEPRADQTDFPFDQLGEKPVIYISLGTVINNNPEFYKQCLRVFANADYQVVMSVGRRIEINSLGDIPTNFIVCNFVPQLDILQRTSLFITHAGMNSVHEGLYYNVPLLLTPQQAEQNMVANCVQRLGAGIKLSTPPITDQQLRENAYRILNDSSFRERAQAVGESFREAGGYKQAADEILSLAH